MSCLLSSCNKEETEPSEWDNWQQRNEEFLNSVVRSWQANKDNENDSWQRLKVYSKNPATEGSADEYVYVHVLEKGTETESPLYTDSVRIIYEARLIPTASYPEGYVFDSTVNGSFSIATSSHTKLLLSGTVDGFSTALQHMHRGDYWRVYIPYQLGYGTTDHKNSSGVVTVPAYSVMVFDIQLIDFSHAGEEMPVWSSRKILDS